MTRRFQVWMVALVALGLGGCADRNSASGRTLSERGRDSVISRSSLPGAATVGRALQQSDAASQRAASLDSLAQ